MASPIIKEPLKIAENVLLYLQIEYVDVAILLGVVVPINIKLSSERTLFNNQNLVIVSENRRRRLVIKPRLLVLYQYLWRNIANESELFCERNEWENALPKM